MESCYEGTIVAGKFRLERMLGEGGMGLVYAAVHLDLLKHVAIKIIRDELIPREDVVERMLNEARVAAQLRSDHVAQVLDVGRLETGAPFIVMELLQGNDLATYLEESGPLAPSLAVSYVLQACEAVAEAHAFGIIHRDIKPENLFVASRADGEPTVKVLDFGISKDLSADRSATLRNPGLIIGSPQYMSPEAMLGSAIAHPTTDIWSLGAVLYELLTGTRPFEAATISEVCTRVMNEAPSSLRALAPDVSRELEEIVARCLRKDPAERWQTVADLARALAPHGPPGSADLAERAARIASGVRLKPRPSRKSVEPRARETPERRRSAPALAGRWAALGAFVAAAVTCFVAWRVFRATPLPAAPAPLPPAFGAPGAVGPIEDVPRRAKGDTSVAALVDHDTARTAPAQPTPKPGARTRQRAPAPKPVKAKPAPSTAPSTTASSTPSDEWDPNGFGGRK